MFRIGIKLILLVTIFCVPLTALAQDEADEEWKELVSDDETLSISYPPDMYAAATIRLGRNFTNVLVTNSVTFFQKFEDEEEFLEAGEQVVVFVPMFPGFSTVISSRTEEELWNAFAGIYPQIEVTHAEFLKIEGADGRNLILPMVSYLWEEEEGIVTYFQYSEGVYIFACAATPIGELEDFRDTALQIIASVHYSGTAEDLEIWYSE